MNIWYFHHYGTPYDIPGLHRPFEFGGEFVRRGDEVTVFTSSYLHYCGRNMIEDKSRMLVTDYDGVSAVFVRTLGYSSSGVKRIENMVQFYIGLFYAAKKYAKAHGKPDIIIASSPHPLTMMAGNSIAKKYGIPCICEVRDFWPEVFFTAGRLKETSLLGRFLLAREKAIYEKCNALLFLKEGDHEYLREHKWCLPDGKIDMSKCFYVNNGVDIALFDRRMTECTIAHDADLEDNTFKLVYCGAVRPINHVEVLLDVAKRLGNKIKVLIYGDGVCLPEIRKRAEEENISNVVCKGYVENKYVPYVLSKSSVNILNYSATDYNWSRGNSSNKLFEYLASGKPVVSTVQMGYDILSKYSCGLSAKECTADGIADVVQQFLDMPREEYENYCRNARATAKLFDIPVLADRYHDIIETVIHNFRI